MRRLEEIGMEWGRRKVEGRKQENWEVDEVQPERRSGETVRKSIA